MTEILSSTNWVWFVLLLWLAPLAGFTVQIFIGRYLPREGDWVSIGAVGISFLLSMLFFTQMVTGDGTIMKTASFTWVPAGIVSADDGNVFLGSLDLGFLVDHVTIIMLFVVTLVSFLVHLYSVGYMEGDDKYPRFFAFLNLFTFSMLGLILVDNIFGLYIFWELVGLCSYLLIGFWFESRDLGPAKASIKAFLTTRVGDIGMFIGILLVVMHLGVMNYHELFQAVAAAEPTGGFSSLDFTFEFSKLGAGMTDYTLFSLSGHQVWTIAGIGLFMGAVGKSAQFPLHIWLPDAMEGPTPVSALIHAATMVAAGVYLVARLFPFFTKEALVFIALVGGFTAFFAATMALVADGIKRVLAYSTISQLGYMILALGVGGWLAGFSHLYTHAYFKALLFLCSGSVIHAVHTNDMWEMGGLRKAMPWTFATMMIATLSISGVPLFSGFITKDKILFETLLSAMEGNAAGLVPAGGIIDWLLPVFGFGAAVLTAFYMFRLMFLTFFGEPRDEEAYEHAHESPNNMVVPLTVLAALSFFFVIGPNPIGSSTWFEKSNVGLEKPTREKIRAHGGSVAAMMGADAGISHGKDHQTAENQGESSGHESAKNNQNSGGTDHHDQKEKHDTSGAKKKGHGKGHGGHGELEKEAHNYTLGLSLFVVIIGIGGAGLLYWEPMKLVEPKTISNTFAPLYHLLERKYYINELVYGGLVLPALSFSRFLADAVDLRIIDSIVDGAARFVLSSSTYSRWTDDNIVDGVVNYTADGVSEAGNVARSPQTGRIRAYLGMIATGVLVLVVFTFLFLDWGTGGTGWDYLWRFIRESVVEPQGMLTVVLAVGGFLALCALFGKKLAQWVKFGLMGE